MTVVWLETLSPLAREHRGRRRRAANGRRPVFGWLRHWRQRARQRAELASLDDRMLADIGISRAEAEFLSSKPFWRE
jgi:uncharacterized protein YjiS (DUF1127 family)